MRYPRAAVAATVFGMRRGVIDPRRVVLVVRGRPPATGKLAVPGGKVDLGETMVAAAARELREETGLEAEFPVDPAFYATDAITTEPTFPQGILFHYTICHLLAFVHIDGPDGSFPELDASSDAASALWGDTANVILGGAIGGMTCVDGTATVVARAIEDWRRRGVPMLSAAKGPA